MNSFKIYEAEVIDRALKINDTLIISDIHLGYESTLNKQGLMLPQIQFDKIIDSLENIQKKAKASSIILNGDIVEKIKTYLKGTWQNYNLIVIPSFTQISYGSDILHEKTISPFIEDINNFEVIAVEEGDIYPFGYVKDIISINHELNNY